MPSRFAYVDLLRGLSALVILIYHYRWFFAQGIEDFRVALKLIVGDVPRPFLSTPWALLAFITLIIALSIPTYRLFELPMQMWIRRFARAGST